MALDIFLKLDTVVGESADKTHRKEIDVLFWSWGMLNTGSAHAGGGAGTGKGYVKDLTVTKYVDKSSPALMLGCCSAPITRARCSPSGESWRERASRVPQNKDARSLHCERYHTKRH
jgi:Type VI secretion system effector, Hcp